MNHHQGDEFKIENKTGQRRVGAVLATVSLIAAADTADIELKLA